MLSKGEEVMRTEKRKKKISVFGDTKKKLFVLKVKKKINQKRIFVGQKSIDPSMKKNCYFMTVLVQQFGSGPCSVLEKP